MGIRYNSARYKKWRGAIYARDNFQCQLCGNRGGVLNAHHIIRKADAPQIAYRIDNGITLCKTCHDIITENESMFAPLFTSIIKKKLTIDFVYSFFAGLTTVRPDLIKRFKSAKRWLQIPQRLVDYIYGQTRKAKE